ncbi:hypothetical protein M0R45_026098 [Rubus argutus]|uniref:Secreted protein n=1 Tax=Rubus argutus TaxID=59490 RepID=A0AAW1WWK3_RUBAR
MGSPSLTIVAATILPRPQLFFPLASAPAICVLMTRASIHATAITHLQNNHRWRHFAFCPSLFSSAQNPVRDHSPIYPVKCQAHKLQSIIVQLIIDHRSTATYRRPCMCPTTISATGICPSSMPSPQLPSHVVAVSSLPRPTPLTTGPQAVGAATKKLRRKIN